MKKKLRWILKLCITVGLLVLIFTEIGEKYLPLKRSQLTSSGTTGLIYKRSKRFLGFLRGQPEAQLSNLDELCSLDNKHVYLFKFTDIKGKEQFAVIDRDIHCNAGAFEKIFVLKNGSYAEAMLNQVADEKVYIKSKGWWRVAPIKPADLWHEISNFEMGSFWFWIFVAFLMKGLGIAASLGRWVVLLKGQNIRLPLRYLAEVFMVGRFFGMLLPSTIGLDGYRLLVTIKQTRKPVECTAVIAVEKLIGFVALFGLAFMSLPFASRLVHIERPAILGLILGMLGLFIIFVLLLLFSPRLATALFTALPFPMKSKFQNKINRVVKATTAYSDKKMLLVSAILLGFGVHAGTILMYFATMRAIIAENVDIYDVFFASTMMIMGTVFGPTIGGEGIRELIFTVLLGPKAGAAKAFLLGHLGFWVGEFLFSIPGMLAYLFRPSYYRSLSVEELQKLQGAGS